LKFLLRWAWLFIAFCFLFSVYGPQILFLDYPTRGFAARSAYGLGVFAGNFPAIVVLGAVAGAVARLFGHKITTRLVALSLGIGGIITTVLIYPIVVYRAGYTLGNVEWLVRSIW
jgi:hypothetical protein